MATYSGTVVGLHGFTQSSESWGPLGELLAAAYPWQPLDLPGHGHGGPACSVPEAAQAIDRQLNGARCLLGYSLGARVALRLALDHPHHLDRLVLISGTPGIEDAVERASRRESDEALAELIETNGLDAFLDRWLANPMFEGLKSLPYARDGRDANDAASLAASLRLAGTGSMVPLWSRLEDLGPEVLIVVGERDQKFKEIGLRMTELVPDARIVVVGGAGHAVHLEAPEATAEAVLAFLSN